MEECPYLALELVRAKGRSDAATPCPLEDPKKRWHHIRNPTYTDELMRDNDFDRVCEMDDQVKVFTVSSHHNLPSSPQGWADCPMPTGICSSAFFTASSARSHGAGDLLEPNLTTAPMVEQLRANSTGNEARR